MSDEDKKLGATGQFPDGKICKHDEGQIRVAVCYNPKINQVVIDFGTSVKWMSFSPAQAIGFAKAILQKAEEAGEQYDA